MLCISGEVTDTAFAWGHLGTNRQLNLLSCLSRSCYSCTWVISKVLHTVRFLLKNEFILQNKFTGLQCNLHCALSQWSNVWASLVFLSGLLLCWCVWLLVTSLDTTSMLLKRFPQSGFFNFGNKAKADGLMSGMYGGWGSTCHPYFSKISDTAPEAWGRRLIYDRRSLREIWLQSVWSSIWRLRLPEQGPRSLPICTHCSLLKCGSQLSRKSEHIILLAAQTQVCRTSEMTYV